MNIKEIITDREFIRTKAESMDEEHLAFREYLQSQESHLLDALVMELQEQVTAAVDCTECGACCRGLMINITPEEAGTMSTHLNITETAFKEQYAEESLQGKLIMNTIPCHFLSDKKCTVYEARFHECREFPHLHKPNFKERIFGSLIHYAMCPIIFNVIECLKEETGFYTNADKETALPSANF